MACEHCRDVITVSDMDAFNCYVSVLLLSASAKFSKLTV